MKILLNFFLALIVAFSATGQARGQIVKGSQIWLYDNNITTADSAAVNSTTGLIRYDPVTGKFRFYNALSGTWFTYGTGGAPVGTAFQIPFTNSGATSYSFDADFSYNPTSFTFKSGSNISITNVTSNYNFLSGDGTTLTGISGNSVQWASIFGEASSITFGEASRLVNNPFIIGGYLNGINLNAGSGNIFSPFIIGTRNTISNSVAGNFTSPMIIGYRSTTEGNMSLVTGFRGHATAGGVGSFVHGFTTTYNGSGSWTGTVEPTTAGGRGAVNISANSEAQTVGHGAYGDYSAILGGIDADIPSTSPRSVILGGNAIKARASDPDEVYVPGLTIATAPTNDDALTQILARDATTGEVKYRDASSLSGGSAQTVDTYSRQFEDFDVQVTGAMGTSAFNNGGGVGGTVQISSFGQDGTENAVGVLEFPTASSTAGGSSLTNTTYRHSVGFGTTHSLTFRAALSALSDGTDTYNVRLGYVNSHQTAVAATNGAYFRYTHSSNGGRWEAVCTSSAVSTQADTGVAAAAGTFSVFKIVINSAGTQADFYIDGVLTNSITTNIPTASGITVGQAAVIEKVAGSTSRSLYIDYYEKIVERSTAR